MTNTVKNYTNTEIITSDPFKLILLLYDACLKHLFLTRDAMKEGDIKARGEHLGKAIQIISELINSLSDDHEDEAVSFLHGLYMAIIKELGKVSVTNDITTVELSIKYVAQLRHIWKEHVMKEKHTVVTDKDKKASKVRRVDLKQTHCTVNTVTYSNLGALTGV